MCSHGVALLGTDRHGKLTRAETRIREIQELGPYSVVCTDTSIGVFAATTKIKLKDGNSARIDELVTDVTNRPIWIENVAAIPESAKDFNLKETLRPIAAAAYDEEIIVRRRSNQAPRGEARKYSKIAKHLNTSFCVISCAKFAHFLTEDWPEAIISLAQLLFHDVDEEAEQIDIAASGFLLWYLSALRASEVKYVLTFDSIQHSLFSVVRQSNDRRSPFEPVRSLFFTGEVNQLFALEWDDRSWSPLISGFIAGQ